MARAHLAVGPAGTDAHVEGLDGQTLVVEAHHGRPAGRPVLHVAQVGVVVQQDVAPAGGGGGQREGGVDRDAESAYESVRESVSDRKSTRLNSSH